MNRINVIALFVLCLSIQTSIYAQEYKHEIGGALGVSSYMGDANRTKLFMNVGPSVGLMHRYNLNLNWALKSNLVVGGVSGDTRYSQNIFPNDNQVSFERAFVELGSQIEYNFFPYSDKYSYLNTRSYTPYIFVGIGLTAGSGDNMFFNANLPLGFGFKYKIKERLNIGIEFSMRKIFGDDFDVTTKNNNWSLNRPFDIKSSIVKNNDWYSLTLLFLTWEFGLKNDPCCGDN